MFPVWLRSIFWSCSSRPVTWSIWGQQLTSGIIFPSFPYPTPPQYLRLWPCIRWTLAHISSPWTRRRQSGQLRTVDFYTSVMCEKHQPCLLKWCQMDDQIQVQIHYRRRHVQTRSRHGQDCWYTQGAPLLDMFLPDSQDRWWLRARYHSKAHKVASVVLQGAILRPSFFMCFLNDLQSVIDAQTSICLFTDDCLLYRSIRSTSNKVQLQHTFSMNNPDYNMMLTISVLIYQYSAY